MNRKQYEYRKAMRRELALQRRELAERARMLEIQEMRLAEAQRAASANPTDPHGRIRTGAVTEADAVESLAIHDYLTPLLDQITDYRLYPEFGGMWNVPTDHAHGANWPYWRTPQEHGFLRTLSRTTVTINSNGVGLLRGLCGYVVGKGYTARATTKDKDVPAWLLAQVQDVIDEFTQRTLWYELQRGLFRSSRKNGEFFLRHYFLPGGRTEVREVWPECVLQPPGGDVREWSFGIHTDPRDLETPHAYYVADPHHPGDGEEVSAYDVEHYKLNVERQIKRGCPDFVFDTREVLEMARRLRRNLSVGGAAQAAIAWIEEYENTPQNLVEGITSRFRDLELPRMSLGGDRTSDNQMIEPGEVRHINKGKRYVTPPGPAAAESHIAITNLCFRSAAQRWNAPEWLASADSSNNNYACHDPETELLTRRGWLRWDQIHADEVAATRNPETGRFEWQMISAIHVYPDYDGDMVRVRSRDMDLFVTPNHRMYASRRQYRRVGGKMGLDGIRPFEFKQADELRAGDILPLTCEPHEAIPAEMFVLPGVRHARKYLNESGHASLREPPMRNGVIPVSIRKRRTDRPVVIAANHLSRDHYAGVVWCVTVPNGLVITRRNGKAIVTGNSSLVAESPFVRTCEADQDEYAERFKRTLIRVVRHALRSGLIEQVGEEVLRRIDVQVTPPLVAVRDRNQEVQRLGQEIQLGITSKQTAAQELDRDWENEQTNIRAEADDGSPQAAADPQQQGQGDQGGGGGDDPLAALMGGMSESEQLTEAKKEAKKDGVYTDTAGRRYRIENGKRAPLRDEDKQKAEPKAKKARAEPAPKAAPVSVEEAHAKLQSGEMTLEHLASQWGRGHAKSWEGLAVKMNIPKGGSVAQKMDRIRKALTPDVAERVMQLNQIAKAAKGKATNLDEAGKAALAAFVADHPELASLMREAHAEGGAAPPAPEAGPKEKPAPKAKGELSDVAKSALGTIREFESKSLDDDFSPDAVREAVKDIQGRLSLGEMRALSSEFGLPPRQMSKQQLGQQIIEDITSRRGKAERDDVFGRHFKRPKDEPLPTAGPKPPEPGFTGFDSNGHYWENGVQKAKPEEATTGPPAGWQPPGDAGEVFSGRITDDERPYLTKEFAAKLRDAIKEHSATGKGGDAWQRGGRGHWMDAEEWDDVRKGMGMDASQFRHMTGALMKAGVIAPGGVIPGNLVSPEKAESMGLTPIKMGQPMGRDGLANNQYDGYVNGFRVMKAGDFEDGKFADADPEPIGSAGGGDDPAPAAPPPPAATKPTTATLKNDIHEAFRRFVNPRGTADVSAIVEHLRQTHPGIGDDDIRAALFGMEKHGYELHSVNELSRFPREYHDLLRRQKGGPVFGFMMQSPRGPKEPLPPREGT